MVLLRSGHYTKTSIMAQEKHDKLAALYQHRLKEVETTLKEEDGEEFELCYERVCQLIKDFELSIDNVAEEMIVDKPLEEITEWTNGQKETLKVFKELRKTAKEKVADYEVSETTKREEAKQQRRQENASSSSTNGGASSRSGVPTLKLKGYTITPFQGDYVDWLRFWSQFETDVDKSTLAATSKLNYLLECLRGKPKEDILGLPHTAAGYDEAKRILSDTYGKDIKVHRSLIKELESLPEISNTKQSKKVHEFYEKLARTIRTLRTMNKIDSAQSAVYTLLDKLGPVREILAQRDDNWENWKLEQLVEHLRLYVERNPISLQAAAADDDEKTQRKERDKMLMFKHKTNACVYCSSADHKSVDCTQVLTVQARKEKLQTKGLCFNCTGGKHRAAKCSSRGCHKCGGKHHTSICNIPQPGTIDNNNNPPPPPQQRELLTMSNMHESALHPMAIVTVCTYEVRLMIDSGAGSSYISTTMIRILNLKPARTETRIIEQMYGCVTRKVEIYTITLFSKEDSDFSMTIECVNAEKDVLTYLPNPKIKKLKKRYPHLQGLHFADEKDTRDQLPIHILLGTKEYPRIRTTTSPIIGPDQENDPGAEFTVFGWVLYGKTVVDTTFVDRNFMLNSAEQEFELLCSTDILGLSEPSPREEYHSKFAETIEQTEEGFYETDLPFLPNHPAIPTNRELAIARLHSTRRNAIKKGILQQYDSIIQDQIKEGILEPVPPGDPAEDAIIHWNPHHAVVRPDAETTKVRVVHDLSAKVNHHEPSLNEIMDPGPPLQPLLFDIRIRNRMRPYVVTGDIKKAFFQIRVREKHRDAQRVLWYDDINLGTIQELRFARVMFGASPSPYILGATLDKHVDKYSKTFPDTVRALKEDTYIDDVQDGDNTPDVIERFKKEATAILREGGFTLHKWHDNAHKQLSDALVTPDMADAKLFGNHWDTTSDQVFVTFEPCYKYSLPVTKKKMIASINSVNDVVGIGAAVTIVGKMIFSKVCERKTISWHSEIPIDILDLWEKWIKTLKEMPYISVPRCVIPNGGYAHLTMHGFSDASKNALCAAVYMVPIAQDGRTDQNLLVSKARIAKKNVSIPRLELTAAVMLAKLMTNVCEILHGYMIHEKIAWVDSTTVLYWLANKGRYSEYVANRVRKIEELAIRRFRHVPTKDNPSDIGTRGSSPSKLGELWKKGPRWVIDPEQYPVCPELSETPEVVTEIKKPKEKLFLQVNKDANDWDHELIERFSFWKLVRVTAWVQRFIFNCRNKVKQREGSLKTIELKEAETYWVKRAQTHPVVSDIDLRLRKDKDGVLRYHGRVPGYNPIFLPRQHPLAAKLIEHYHFLTLHGGVQSTISKIRTKFWIPRIRRMTNGIRSKCNRCRAQRVKPLLPPAVFAELPEFRAELTDPFTAVGVDFAGPLYYRCGDKTNKQTEKAYVALFTCATTRAVHLKLCKSMTTEEFKESLTEVIARRGTPKIIVSDNAKTFEAADRWLQTISKDDDLNDYLAKNEIVWKFNLSRAPWWGGFFERLIGVMKSTLSKVIGKALLSFDELRRVILDTEIHMNNRPLCYVGEDFDHPVITPNILLHNRPSVAIDESILTDEDFDYNAKDILKRSRFIQKCKDDIRKRWTREYLHSLEERRRGSVRTNDATPTVGAVVLIKDSITENKGKWKLGRIVSEVRGHDNVLRGYEVLLGNGYTVERPLQLVGDLEIDNKSTGFIQKRKVKKNSQLNVNVKEFVPRNRSAKTVAKDGIRSVQIVEMTPQ